MVIFVAIATLGVVVSRGQSEGCAYTLPPSILGGSYPMAAIVKYLALVL